MPFAVIKRSSFFFSDGLEAARSIRQWENEGKLPASRLPIFAITGNARQGQVDGAISAGMDRVFIKRESSWQSYHAPILIQLDSVQGFRNHSTDRSRGVPTLNYYSHRSIALLYLPVSIVSSGF